MNRKKDSLKSVLHGTQDTIGGFILPTFKITTGALSGTTASAGDLTGANICIVNSTTNGGSYTTRTAAQMITDGGLQPGQQWMALLINSGGAGTLTLAGGSNVTIVGTATLITVTARLYAVALNNASSAITFTYTGFAFTATGLAFVA